MLSFGGTAGLETLLIREDVSGVHVISQGCAEIHEHTASSERSTDII